MASAPPGRRQPLRRRPECAEGLLSCADSGTHPVQYVDMDQLKRGEVNKFPVLYAPLDYAMDEATIAALKEYVKQGGTLWADGITAWKNERGKIYPTIPGHLTDLFGVEAVEIYPIQPSQSIFRDAAQRARRRIVEAAA